VKYNIISYFIGEGLKNVLKNKKSTITSITTMCLTMLMFGAFFIIGENANYIVKIMEQKQGMQVYIDNVENEDKVKEIEQKIRNIKGVNTVTYVSNEEAINLAREQLKENENFIAGMDYNYFPASFTVTLTDLSLNEDVKNEINKIDEVTEIVSAEKSIKTLDEIARGLRIGILIILIALIIITIFIISNTIKLSVHARRKEISIMKYVGATNNFIRWPFMVEGVIIGIISAFITIMIVGVIYNRLATKAVQFSVFQRMDIGLIAFSDMFRVIMLIYLAIGVGIGLFGSSRSMKKYLEV
jgi:cell division transport system permease protein